MRLHRLNYSPYARFVEAALALAKVPCEVVDVAYGDREALARLTSGYIMVPVLERDDGTVLCDSRVIMSTLWRDDARVAALVPEADAGPIWAYVDWVCNQLEDVAFRLASPGVRDRFGSAFERALYVFVKERKFGPGCVDQWAADALGLEARMHALLEPTCRTLAARPFLFGSTPTLADCALHGVVAMLEVGAPGAAERLARPLQAWRARLSPLLAPG